MPSDAHDPSENLPARFEDEDQLEDWLSRPPPGLVRDLASLDGDLMVLGAGGKMGPTLARMARRAFDQAGPGRTVYAVSRFSDPEPKRRLEAHGVETVVCDLMDAAAAAQLPRVPNLVYMVGRKFGTTGSQWRTWAINTYLPGRVLSELAPERCVAFSTGNVYPLVPVSGGGSRETDLPEPVGEYAQSCLGRERMVEHVAREKGFDALVLRLNYAVECRYGVLCDVAQAVWHERPIDLGMGHVNVVWQGDANAYALRALTAAAHPPAILNVTGPETVSVRWLAQRFADRLDREPRFTGVEQETALLSNAARAFRRFGYPSAPLLRVVDWVADWIASGGPLLEKPTHFEERAGTY